LTDWHLHSEYEIFPEWRWRYAPGVMYNTEHVFGLLVSGPVEIRIAQREHLGFDWLPWEEAAQRCFSWSNAAAIRKLGRAGS
jgi:dATP pyrophosphohydrolase